MRDRVLSLTTALVTAALVAGCASSGAPAASDPGRALRSERRLRFLLVAPAPPGTEALRDAVADEMRGLGLPVTDDAHDGYDVEVRVAPAPAAAEMRILADGRVLDRLTAAAPEPRVLAHTLVLELARSQPVSGYADSLYGRRLRPLRETLGRRARVPGDHGGTPPLESLGPSDEDSD